MSVRTCAESAARLLCHCSSTRIPAGVARSISYERSVPAPVLANITEFGKTPLFTVEELREAGVRLVLYPLSAFRAMSAAAVGVYGAIRREGTQQAVIDQMQTRADLYDVLNYAAFEAKLDDLFAKRKNQ